MSNDVTELQRRIDTLSRMLQADEDEIARLTAALADERRHADALAEALHDAVAALEMVTDQDAIKNTRVDMAFACCVEAAAKGRKLLADQNPIRSSG